MKPSQAGDSNYLAAPQVQQTVVVGTAAITANVSGSQAHGSASPGFTYTDDAPLCYRGGLGQPGRLLPRPLERGRGVHAVEHQLRHRQLHRGGGLRHRRQPGRGL
jgi:hypothetical protein